MKSSFAISAAALCCSLPVWFGPAFAQAVPAAAPRAAAPAPADFPTVKALQEAMQQQLKTPPALTPGGSNGSPLVTTLTTTTTTTARDAPAGAAPRKRAPLRTAAAFAQAGTLTAQGASAPVASPSQSLALYVGEAKVINQSNVNRIAVGNGKLVSATVVDDRQILLIGEGAGTTVVHVWLKGGAEYDINLTVVQNDNAKALQEMRSLLANTKGVHAGTVGDKIVLAGEYADQEAVQRVKTVTDAYPQVLNMIAANQTDTKVYPAKMVYLDVKVVEVRKSALERLGIKWGDSVAGPTVATTGYFYADTQFRGVDRPAGFPITTATRPFTSYVGIASQLASTINFLEQSGDGWTLAEPRLSCQSGQKARFQVGGEIPIAVSAGFGQTQVVYKPYGIILEFEPTADNDGNVNTKLGAEVSEIDGKNSSTGLTAFTKNRTDTVVTMKANETLVLSGLLKNTGAKAADQLPGLGSIPLIGALFRNKQFANERTELVVLVTPRMISADSELNKELVQRGTSRIESVRDLIRTQMAD